MAGQRAGVPYKYFGDWTDRVAKGELPKTKPPRPQGIERNLVVTTWDWSTPDKYLHDLISSDKRNPTVNANGPLYGSPEYSTDNMPILDPKTNKVTVLQAAGARSTTCRCRLGRAMRRRQAAAALAPIGAIGSSGTRGPTTTTPCSTAWAACGSRRQSAASHNPAWCKKGSDNQYAKIFPLDKSQRQIAMLDPKTMKYSFVDTCFATHHLQFGFDADNTLWLSGTGPVAGWINTKVLDETGDAQKAEGWTPFVLDPNGNGKLDDYVQPSKPASPARTCASSPARDLMR